MAYEKEENYCSFSPDEIAGVRFNYACYLHDRQYRNEVKIRKTRKQTDDELRDRIYESYAKVDKKILGFIISRVYYFAVRLFCDKTWVN
jgi:hypothetical protein